MKSFKPQGFTLLELLVVVGILGILSAALLPAISNAVLRSNMAEVGMKGRDIYIAVAGANSQRKLLGLDSVWPRTETSSGGGSGSTDISNRAFYNSSDYFYELYDGKNIGTSNWRPYVVGFDYSKLSGAGVSAKADLVDHLSAENNMWTIAANVRDEMADIIPVLVTRNVDCRSLYKDLPDGSVGDELAWSYTYRTPFSNKGFVMIRKGGAVFRAHEKYATVRVVYQNQSFMTTDWGSSLPPLIYLAPDSAEYPK